MTILTCASSQRRMLRASGYAVEVAGDSDEALVILEEDAGFDALLVDYVMPGMDGMALAQHLRRKRPALRVLLMTGYAELRESEEVDTLDIIRKPFDVATLSERIEQILRRPMLRAPPWAVRASARHKGLPRASTAADNVAPALLAFASDALSVRNTIAFEKRGLFQFRPAPASSSAAHAGHSACCPKISRKAVARRPGVPPSGGWRKPDFQSVRRPSLGVPIGDCLLSARKAVMPTMPQAIDLASAWTPRSGCRSRSRGSASLTGVAHGIITVTETGSRLPRQCPLAAQTLIGRNHTPQHCLFSVREHHDGARRDFRPCKSQKNLKDGKGQFAIEIVFGNPEPALAILRRGKDILRCCSTGMDDYHSAGAPVRRSRRSEGSNSAQYRPVGHRSGD